MGSFYKIGYPMNDEYGWIEVMGGQGVYRVLFMFNVGLFFLKSLRLGLIMFYLFLLFFLYFLSFYNVGFEGAEDFEVLLI